MTPDHALATELQGILHCAAGYSAEVSPPMERRQSHLSMAVELLDAQLKTNPNLSQGTDLWVEHGGRRSSFGPVPWIRIFDHDRSPSATAGFYLVYLFGGTGRRLYLSLNQGTSEWRSGKMRPVRSEYELTARASVARGRIRSGSDRYLTELALDVGQMPVGGEAKQRARNYELANIYALEYDADALPSDEQLLADLSEFLPALADLYVEASSDAATLQRRRPRHSRPAQGLAGEALSLAIERLSADGWVVEASPHGAPFTLSCSGQDSSELHVLCKVALPGNAEIPLSREEMAHARTFDDVALFLLTMERDSAIGTLVRPFRPDEERSIPVSYLYRLPNATAH